MVAVADLPTIVIIGPTASGKTALAIEIARRHNGEIICADSRTVFRGMDIGTAKPTIDERSGVPHWGLDLVDPGERFTAAQFQSYTNDKIDEIKRRQKVPIIVGGTGLYVDGVIFDYHYPAEPSPEDRKQLENMTSAQLHKYCVENNIELPINDKNKRHLVRSIIHQGQPQQRREKARADVWVYGIAVDKSTLRTRIAKRAEQMFEAGVVDEAKMLGENYGWGSEAMTGSIYPLVHKYLEQSVTLEEVMQAFAMRDWQLAKRQMTWFRRNSEIAWGTADDIKKRVKDVLASGHNM